MHLLTSKPWVSVIVAVFNRAATLQQCIDSVAQQSYPYKELIVIDGGSTDGSVELLRRNQEKISYWVSESDQGIYDAWNKGLAHAKGEWIWFLGADDYFWDTQVLERVAAVLEKLPSDIRVAYGQIMLVNKEGVSLFAVGEPWEKVKQHFKQKMCIPHPGTMHRRSLFERHGRFDTSFRIAGDYELLLRELKTADAFFIPDITVAMRQGGLSTNPESNFKMLCEVGRALRLHGRYFPVFLWLAVMIMGYMRLMLWHVLGERRAGKVFDFERRMRGLPPYWTKI